MNAIDVLSAQHREVMSLFERLERAGDDRRRELLEELADTLAIHMAIEERIFYPATNRARTEDLLLEAVEEHLAAKRAMADLLATSVRDRSFRARAAICRDLVAHHVTEEEEKLFPAVSNLFDAGALERLGAQMQGLTAELTGGRPPTPKQTDFTPRLE